jgi:hypothetical protein
MQYTPRLSPNQIYKKKLKIYSFNNSTVKSKVKKQKFSLCKPFKIKKTKNISQSSFKKSIRYRDSSKNKKSFSQSKANKNQKKANEKSVKNKSSNLLDRRRKNNSHFWVTLKEFDASFGNNKNFQSEMSHNPLKNKTNETLKPNFSLKPNVNNNYSVNLYKNDYCPPVKISKRESSKQVLLLLRVIV